MIKYMAVAVAVAVSGGVAVPVTVPVALPVAGLTKRFFNYIQKDFLINVWGYGCTTERPFSWNFYIFGPFEVPNDPREIVIPVTPNID